MEILLAVLLFSAGIVLAVKGGDWFIDAAVWISDVTGISRAVIGATLVSFATTSPEFFVSVIAVSKGYNDLAVGNAVGSLICNIGVAFAILAIFMPGKIHDGLYALKGIIMIAATFLLWIFSKNGYISSGEGVVLFTVFAVFTFINIKFSKEDKKIERKKTNSREIALNMSKFIIGAAAIVYGSDLIVDNCQIIATAIGISEAVTGLTLVAIGTSLPEIVTSISAIVKKECALSIGNIIGANTLDATLILAVCSIISGGQLSVSQSAVGIDIPVTLILMVLAVIPSMVTKRIHKLQGGAILGVYLLYIGSLFI